MDLRHGKALFLLHLTVLLYGFTAILGKLISINPVELVWYRIGIATLSLFFFIPLYKRFQWITKPKDFIKVSFIGVTLATHWICFFHAIHISNVTITLIGLSTFPIFTAILEPLYFRESLNKIDIISSLLACIGIILIVTSNFFVANIFLGLFYGILTAILASIFTILNREMLSSYDEFSIGTYQFFTSFVFISIWKFTLSTDIAEMAFNELIYMLILATVCTSFAHVANIYVMHILKAFTVSLAISLEPVYGILLAFLIFNEGDNLTLGFLLGSITVLIAVFLRPIVLLFSKK